MINDLPEQPKLSIVNNLGLDKLPEIIHIDLEECSRDKRLAESIREFANYLKIYQYSAPGFFFYGMDTKELTLLYEYVLRVPDEIKQYKAGTKLSDLQALHNLLILTYLLARCEGEVDILDVAFNQLKYTCFAVQLSYLQFIGEAAANIERYSVLRNEKFPECYKPFGTLIKSV